MFLEDFKSINEKPSCFNSDGIGLLVYPKQGNFPSTCHYDGSRFWFNGKDITNEVEFWTYLPPKPKK